MVIKTCCHTFENMFHSVWHHVETLPLSTIVNVMKMDVEG